jgi:hypothetical protein
MDVSVTDSISQGFPFLPSSLSAFAPMIPRSGSINCHGVVKTRWSYHYGSPKRM